MPAALVVEKFSATRGRKSFEEKLPVCAILRALPKLAIEKFSSTNDRKCEQKISVHKIAFGIFSI